MELDQAAKEYLLAEFQDRRSQILVIIQQMDANQRYSLAATAIFWAWVASQPPQPAFYAITWIPLAIVTYFFVRWRLLRTSITVIAEYVKRVEERFALPEGLGWEHRTTSERRSFYYLYWTYWVLLLLANAVLAILVPFIWFWK